MSHYVEIFATTDESGDRQPYGGADTVEAYKTLKEAGAISAVYHSIRDGVITSTIHAVDDEAAAESDVDAYVGTHEYHKKYTEAEAILRGFEVAPGTLTASEVDTLATELSDTYGVDITTATMNNVPQAHVFYDLPDDVVDTHLPSWSESPPNPGPGGPDVSGTAPTEPIATVLKQDYFDIPDGSWLSVHPDLTEPEVVSLGEADSAGHSEDGEYAVVRRDGFYAGTNL